MSSSAINTEFAGMLSPKALLTKYPKAKRVKNKRGKALTAQSLGRLVNWGIIEGSAFPYGGCVVTESSFIEFVESRGIELTESPQPF